MVKANKYIDVQDIENEELFQLIMHELVAKYEWSQNTLGTISREDIVYSLDKYVSSTKKYIESMNYFAKLVQLVDEEDQFSVRIWW